MTKEHPTPEVLRELLRYEPETGKLYWKERDRKWFKRDQDWKMWNKRYKDAEAFTSPDNNGYYVGGILGRRYHSHRVIWAIQTNRWPEENIDHINQERGDNRWKNLREATTSQNGANRGTPINNTSGFKGVTWAAQNSKWRAQINAEGKNLYLGYFDCPIEAAKIRDAATRHHHGEFASLNFP